MSCGTCGIQAGNTMQGDTGVPAGAPQSQRPRCPHCKAFISQEEGLCHNPRCPGTTTTATPAPTAPWEPTAAALQAAGPNLRAALDNIMTRGLHVLDEDDAYKEAQQARRAGPARRRFEVLESMVAQDLLQGDPERDDHIHEIIDALAIAYGDPNMADEQVVALAKRHYWTEGILYDREAWDFLDKHPAQTAAARKADEALIDISGDAPRLIYRVGPTIVEVRHDGSQMVAPWNSVVGAHRRMQEIRKQAVGNAFTTPGAPGLMCPRCHGALYEPQALCSACANQPTDSPTTLAPSHTPPLAHFGRLLQQGDAPVLTPGYAPNAVVLYQRVGRHVAAVTMESEAMSLDVSGYGTCDAAEGYGGGIVVLDLHRDDPAAHWMSPTLYVWADINNPDPTHEISLAGAMETRRVYNPEEDGGDNAYEFGPPPRMPWDELPPEDTTPPRMDVDGMGYALLTRRLNATGLAASLHPQGGVDLDVEGLGTFSTRAGCSGGIVHLDLSQETPMLYVWADITQEDPTHVIDLSGAAESRRKTPNP